MKENYFNPALMKPGRFAPRRFAPRYMGRFRSTGMAFRSDGGEEGKKKDDDDGDGDDKREELMGKISDMVNKALETRATKEELAEILKEQKEGLKDVDIKGLRSMLDDKTGVMAKLITQGFELQKIKADMSKREQKDVSITGQIKDWLDSKAQDGSERTVRESIQMIKNGTRVDLPPLEIRAVASPMLFTTVNAGASPFIGSTQVEAGINSAPKPFPSFWDSLTVGSTNARTYVWLNKVNRDGGADWTPEAGPKPPASFEFEAENSVAKKIAVNEKASIELLDDIDGMRSFILQDMRESLDDKVDATLLSTQAGTSTAPTGILHSSIAKPYSLTTIKTTNPNYVDAIRAAVAQVRASYVRGNVVAFINPIDAANMDLAKASTSGVYILPPFVTADGRNIGGATISENYNVAVGSVLVGVISKYRILVYKDFSISWGWENDDFTKNLVTAIAEKRIHQFFNDINAGCIVYDTFANIIAAIDGTPTP